jgi:uncharacterized protein YcaQ
MEGRIRMDNMTITKEQARQFMLAHQSLWSHYELEGKSGVLSYINRVGCIQFDPLNIVGYNQELVLQARISNFNSSILQELLYKDRELLDGWDKNMSIYCTTDWPFFSRNRKSAKCNLGDSSRPITAILSQVRNEFEEKGPLTSANLDYDQKVQWPWAPTKLSRAVLESMYFWGELIIHHKMHTRKVYDFAKRHIPQELFLAPDPNVTEEQYHDWYIHRRIGAIGLLWNKSGDAWLGISGIKSKERNEALLRLLQKGKIVEVHIEGIETLFYMRSEEKPLLNKVLNSDKQLSRAMILAPLDNLLWDRKLVKEVFNFEYRWEVYKPVTEREYGYYVLPILYGDSFVARFEPGKDKKSGALIIKNWWWEPQIEKTEELYAELRSCFSRFLKYLGTDKIKIDNNIKGKKDFEWLSIS